MNERFKTTMKDQRFLILLIGLTTVSLATSSGCGSSYKRDVARVTGTVKCDGVLLTSGVVIFTPVEVESEVGLTEEDFAKGARGEIQPDGSYELSTYSEGDGAVVGVHEVRVMQVDPEDDDAPIVNEGYACSREVLRFTVEAAQNTIDIHMSTGKG